MRLPKVYIIILNHNTHYHTIECLESVYKLNYPNIQILLIDNSPADFSLNAIADWADGKLILESTLFPEVVIPYEPKPLKYSLVTENELSLDKGNYEKLAIIKANKNEGFASGNNIALRAIKEVEDNCFIWLLNNDTVVEAGALNELISYYASSKEKLGIIGSKLLYYYHKNVINGVGGIYDRWLGVSAHLGESEVDNGQYDDMDCDSLQYVIGASMFISSAFLTDISLLNEEYFLFFEEIDWAVRGKAKGWKLGFAPESIVYHKESASISPETTKNILFETSFLASKIIFTWKYFKRALPVIYCTIVWMAFNRLRRKQFEKIMPIVKVAINPFGFKMFIVAKLRA